MLYFEEYGLLHRQYLLKNNKIMIMDSENEEIVIIFYFVVSLATTVFIDVIYKFYFEKLIIRERIILNHIVVLALLVYNYHRDLYYIVDFIRTRFFFSKTKQLDEIN